MSKASAAELCVLLVKDIYGEVSSKVVAILLEQGRLPLSQICRRSKLPEKTVKQTLVVLIQQHLVVHFTQLDGGREDTYYECDWMQIYELVHAGRIIRAMEDRFGTDGATVVSNLLQLGHARVGDFLAAYGISTAKGMRGKPQAMEPSIETEERISSVETLKAVMGDMLKNCFITEVMEHHMNPRTDVENGLRAELIKKLRGSSTSELKLMKEVNAGLQKKLSEMAVGDTSKRAGMKRKSTAPGGRSRKRTKVSIYDEEEDEAEWEIDEQIVVRANHAKFLVLFRNAELVSLCERRLGQATSLVYAECLKLLEPKIHRCRNEFGEDEDDDEDNKNSKKRISFSTLELSRAFPKNIDLDDSIAEPPKEPAKGRKRSYESDDDDRPRRNGSASKMNGIIHHSDDEEEAEEVDEWAADDELDLDAQRRKKRMAIIKQHLLLLTEDSFRFLKVAGNRGNGEWTVNYRELGKILCSLELEKVVEERFDGAGTRLLRVLKDKGRLDEKQIVSIALLKQGQVRSVLSALHEAGHIELQEVPKSQPPQVSRTYFLWYFDEERANSLLLSDLYKAMSRNMQRTKVEKEKRKPLIEKSERTDVAANYDEYLTKAEKTELEIWRAREDRLLVQLMRLDRVVMILRDF